MLKGRFVAGYMLNKSVCQIFAFAAAFLLCTGHWAVAFEYFVHLSLLLLFIVNIYIGKVKQGSLNVKYYFTLNLLMFFNSL